MTTTERIRIESKRDPATLEHEADAQRQKVEMLIGALEGKLSPGELVNRAFGASKDGGKEFATNLSHTVRANPLPTLLTAGGMLWLYAQRDRPIERGTYDMASDGDSMGDKLSGKWDGTKDKAGSAKDFTKRKAHDAKVGFEHMLEDNPVALGALGVAAGALLGASLPSTESEDRWMGEMRDRVAEDFKRGAKDVTRAEGSANRAH